MSNQLMTMAADLIAIGLLVFGIYFPRHRHRDMIVSYLGINVGVLAISAALSSMDVSIGTAVGLFGVLSIIRLRSDELDQRQVAYYFGALALGLLGGASVTDPGKTIALMALIVGVLWMADHPRLYTRYQTRDVIIDRAFANEAELIAYASEKLAVNVQAVSIKRVNLVDDTTSVQIKYAESVRAASTARPKIRSMVEAAS